jgi:hypothetical protein
MSEFGLDEISKNIYILFSTQLKKILIEIANEHSLDKNKLITKYININMLNNISIKKKKKKNKLEPGLLCMARKQDGNQCTRRRKGTVEYCGKHIKNRRFGRIDEHSNNIDKLAENDNYIMTWVEIFEGDEYLVDSNNIVYSRDITSPKIIGKKIGEGILEKLVI